MGLLRQRLKELQENLRSGNTPEIPGMEKTYRPANQNPVETYNPPEVDVPNVQTPTAPISTNTQTPKTTQPTSPISTPKDSTAKNTAIPSSAKNSSQAPADPKLGEAGAKTLKEIQKSDPMVYIKKNKFLTEAYNAGFYGTDITREARDNARAGGYLKQLEEMINAGIQDSKGMGTDASQHEKLMQELNIEQAQKLANTTGDTDDIYSDGLSIDALRKEKILQKKLDNLKKSGYNSGDTTGDGKDGDKTDLSNFKYPITDFSDINQGYGVWYPPEKGYHMGIDIGDADGKNSNIGAIYDGEVVFSDDMGKNGYMVIIRHTETINGEEITFYSSYSHLKEKGIKKGAKVNAGDKIGIMGKTGNSTGLHLHLAIFTTTMDIDSLRPYGYGSYQINDYAWKSSSGGHTIYYDPNEVFKTNGAIIKKQ